MDIRKVPRRLITTEAQLSALVRDIQKEDVYSADTEYSTINEYAKLFDIAGMSFYLPTKNIAYYIPINHTTVREQISLAVVRSKLAFMSKRNGPQKSLWHNFKADYEVLYQHGIDVWDHKLDTFMGSYLLDDNAKGHYHGLKYLSRKLFNYNQVDYAALIAISAIRRDFSLRKLFKVEKSEGLHTVFERIQDRAYGIEQRINFKVSKIEAKIKEIKEMGDNLPSEQKRIKTLKAKKTAMKRNEFLTKWKELTRDKFINQKRIHDVSMDLVLPYATDDVVCTYLLYKNEKPRLEKINQFDHAINYQTKLAKVLGRMEMRGIPIDLKAVKAELKSTELTIARLDAEIQRYVAKKGWQYTSAKDFAKDGRLLSVNSGPQLSKFLFKDLGLRPGGKTKGGKPKTDAATLASLGHKITEKITALKKEGKIRSTYLLNLIERAVKGKDGVYRIHATFNQYGAATGRLSSKEPNFQNMPGGERIRKFFIAAKRKVKNATQFWRMLVLDYSQLELRILACFSKDKMLTKAYVSSKKAIDIHAFTAAKIFKVAVEEVLKEQRAKAKTMNFGIIYQMGVDKLARSLSISIEEASTFIKEYFSVFGGIDSWINNQIKFIKKNAYSTTLLGRRRRFPYLKLRSVRKNPAAVSRAARQGVNAPIQGCLSGDSLILTKEHGVTQIKDIVYHPVHVWDGKHFVKADVMPSGKKRKVIIEAGGRQTITCSPNHKFWTTNTKGVFAWRRADELQGQLYFAYSNAEANWATPWNKLKIPKNKHSAKTQNITLRSIDDKHELGLLLGRIASDGSISRGMTTTVMVAEHEKNIYNKLFSICKKISPVLVEKTRLRYEQKPFHTILIESKSLAEQLVKMEVKHRIPDIAWQDKEILVGYLRGMFDGDGGVGPDGAHLTFGQNQHKLKWVKEVQRALLFLGIRAHLSYNYGSIRISIRKADSEIFAKIIGFENKIKQRKLKAIVPVIKNKTYGDVLTLKSVKLTKKYIEMFDVVNSKSKTFCANGFVTHNTGQDICGGAMIRIEYKFYDDPTFEMCGQVHDELVCLSVKKHAKKNYKIVQKCMEHPFKANEAPLAPVPLIIEGKIGRSWSECK